MAPPVLTPAHAPAPAPTVDRFATLPRYYGHKDVLALFGGDWGAFLDAWVAPGGQGLPEAVRTTCRDTLASDILQTLLLERLLQHQVQTNALLQDLLTEIQTAPTLESVEPR